MTVTPGWHDQRMPGWNPWAALKARSHVHLTYKNMHPSRGTIVDHGDGLRTITLHAGLSQVDRNDVLSHELVHDELDLIWPPDCPAGIRQKGEALVTRISDERLLPVADLAAYVASKGDEMVLARMVAEDLEVSLAVADRSLQRLAAGF